MKKSASKKQLEEIPTAEIEVAAPTSMAEYLSGLQQKIDTAPGNVDSFGSYDTLSSPDMSNHKQFVFFELGDQLYGLPVEKVVEVIKPIAITPLPNARHGILGLLNLRGHTLPVIDLAAWLDLDSSTAPKASKRIIIFQPEGELIGLLVHEVSEVVSISENSIESEGMVEEIASATLQGFVQHKEHVVTLIASIEVAA